MVAKKQSITKAAKELGYVQSNVTNHIKKLEEEIGTTLFIRTNKGVQLTQEGERLRQHATQVISLLDSINEEFERPKHNLKIGATQTIAGFLLPKWIQKMQQDDSNLHISVYTQPQDMLFQNLIERNLDCILTNTLRMSCKVEDILQFSEPLVIVAPSMFERIEEITSLPLLVNDITSCPYRKKLLHWATSQAQKSLSIMEVDTVEAIINCISLGMGISLLPKRCVQSRKDVKWFYTEAIEAETIRLFVLKGDVSAQVRNLKYSISRDFIELKASIR